jgi:hypothetical protein
MQRLHGLAGSREGNTTRNRHCNFINGGISSISDSGNVSVQGETSEYVKTDINTWSIEGNPI